MINNIFNKLFPAIRLLIEKCPYIIIIMAFFLLIILIICLGKLKQKVKK